MSSLTRTFTSLFGGARKPQTLTRAQKDRKNELRRAQRAVMTREEKDKRKARDRARYWAMTQEEKDRKNELQRARYRARRARQQAAIALLSLQP